MRNLLASLTALFILTATVPSALAEPKDDKSAGQPLSPEDQAKLKKEMRRLAEAFGVQQPAAQAQPAPPAGSSQDKRTMADVADRALDMTGKLVASISATLEKTAPKVWSIMIRQQYAKAIADLVLPWSLFLAGLIFMLISVKYNFSLKFADVSRDGQMAAWVVVRFAPMVSMVVFTIWGAIALATTIKLLVNPEFYAIRDLLTMLLNPGSGAGGQ